MENDSYKCVQDMSTRVICLCIACYQWHAAELIMLLLKALQHVYDRRASSLDTMDEKLIMVKASLNIYCYHLSHARLERPFLSENRIENCI